MVSTTAYDDSFRTLLNDCSELIIPVVNEAFGESYTGKEQIIFGINEHFRNPLFSFCGTVAKRLIPCASAW